MNPYRFMQQGNQAFSDKDYGAALRYYKKALEGIRDDENPMADLYGNIGNVYAATGKIDEAVVAYKEALTILRRLEDYERLGMTYANIGNLYTDNGKPRQGIDYYLQGVLLLERSRPGEALAVLYGNLTLALIQVGDNTKARAAAEKGLSLACDLNHPNLIAQATHRQAKAYGAAGDFEDALRLSASALALFRRLRDESGCAAARYHQAALHEQAGDLDAAIRCLKEVVAFDRRYRLPKLQENTRRLRRLEAKRKSEAGKI